MRTPSLGTRVVLVGVVVVGLLTLAIDLFLYFSLRSKLSDGGDRLLVLEVVMSPLLVVLAVLLLRLVAEVALRPLDQIAAAARRTKQGRLGERLRPDRPDTRLGMVASAYDEMLDSLETAVTEARVAQADSERLESRYRQILETAREAFVAFDADGAIIDWNAEAEKIFGWPRDEALGRDVADTILSLDEPSEPFRRPETLLGLDPSSRPDRVIEIPRAMHRTEGVFPAGATVWVSWHDQIPTINAFLWDKTERLREQEAVGRLAAIVESSDEAMISTDLAGTILTWNDGATRIYGYSPEEAIGRSIMLIVPRDWQPNVEDALAKLSAGETVGRSKVLRRHKLGRRISVELNVAPIRNAAGEIVAASSVARDITQERKVQVQLDASRNALLDAARASEAATRQFLDDAAHQLRAPITSLRASAETLLRGPEADERDRLLGAVVRETSRASRLMSGLLQMARLNKGRSYVAEPCDLVALCREEVDRAHWIAPQLDLNVHEEGETAVGRPAVDSEAVGEILANLLDNARRHARSRVDVHLTRDNGNVTLTVANDGPSIPPDKAEAVFDRFVSLDGLGGAGLGLPIARELARSQGGELTYEDRGFVLRLPAPAQG